MKFLVNSGEEEAVSHECTCFWKLHWSQHKYSSHTIMCDNRFHEDWVNRYAWLNWCLFILRRTMIRKAFFSCSSDSDLVFFALWLRSNFASDRNSSPGCFASYLAGKPFCSHLSYHHCKFFEWVFDKKLGSSYVFFYHISMLWWWWWCYSALSKIQSDLAEFLSLNRLLDIFFKIIFLSCVVTGMQESK